MKKRPETKTTPPEPTQENGASVGTIKPLLLDEETAAAVLSLSARKLWELSASGAIKHVKIGALKRYRPTDLEDWVASGCPTET